MEQPALSERPALPVQIEAQPLDPLTVSLAFVLTNPFSTPVEGQYFKPFIDFDLRIRSATNHLDLYRPRLDIAVSPVSLRMPPGTSCTIPTPIRLAFQEKAEPEPVDPLTWYILHAPVPITLEATLHIAFAGYASPSGKMHLSPW